MARNTSDKAETDDVVETEMAGLVTFRALAAPDQIFRVGDTEYAFNGGTLTTSDPNVIAFLDGNHAAVRIQQ